MMTITRRLAKTLRAAFRKALELRSHAPRVPIQLRTDASGLVVRAQVHDVALEYQEPGQYSPAELTLPISLLKEVEGSKPDPVQLALDAQGRITADWQEGAIPKTFNVEALERNDEAFPAEPQDWTDTNPSIIQAFANALDSVDPGSSRYALECVQLRGKEGSISATDGHHLLKQTGFPFHFDDEILVRPNKLFVSGEFAGAEHLQFAKSDKHLVFRAGGWTLYLAFGEGRFPRIDDVIPRYSDAPTIVTLDAADRTFLAANLRQLPADSEPCRDITFDVNGRVAIRARAGEDLATELVLNNSRKTGPDMLLAMNRRYLQQAVNLGLDQLYLFGEGRPVLARDEHRSLVWMLLDSSCIVPNTPDVRQVFSTAASHPTPRLSSTMPKRKTTPPTPQQHEAEPTSTAKDNATSSMPATDSPLDQAIRLRASLHEALCASNALVRAIKRQSKNDRAYKAAIASLRQLQAAAA